MDDDGLDVTREELDAIGEALKCEEFRRLLCEYVDEINDPENRARYEREVELYERERGADVTFVRPRPGYVLKTSADGDRKVFVNVCSGDALREPTAVRRDGGDRWSLPHCVSPARRDYDRGHRPCDVYDVVFHPRALDMAARGGRLKAMVEDTALAMVERSAGVTLDKTNVKYPKMSFKGVARSLMIRKPIDGFRPRPSAADGHDGDDDRAPPLPGCPAYSPPADRPVQHHDLGPLKQKSLFAVPKHVVKYRSDIDIQEHAYNMHCKMNAVIPKELIVEVHLPLLDSSANVQLDVLPRSLSLVCHKPSKYKLDVALPYSVLEDDGNATFDQSTRKLIVRLPVVRTEPPLEHVKGLVSEMETSEPDKLPQDNSDAVVCNSENRDEDNKVTVNGNDEVIVTNGRHNGNIDEAVVTNGHRVENTNDHSNDTEHNNNIDDVHYILPEHELIFENKCILTLNVKNVDPKSINVIVINDENLISGKFHSIGSGFFPIWFAFCLKIPSKSSLLMSDVKVLPSNKNVILELAIHFIPDCKQYWYGLDRDNLTIQCIKMETHKENSKDLANGILMALNDSDDDDDDVFVDSKEKHEINASKQPSSQTSDDSCRFKNKNDKTTKEKGRKKKGKKIQKSNAIPIVAAACYQEQTEKKIDFIPGSLPIEFNNTRPTIRGILKKRSLSECSSNLDDVILSPRLYSSSGDHLDTETSEVTESSSNDLNNKKTVRFNDHVIEKKINFNLSIAAQAKKHRQRQQRKRNIREYNTPSESEASEAEDKTYGPLNMVSESEETSVSESSAGEMSDDNSSGPMTISSKNTVVADSKKDHKRRKSKSARKNASLAKQASSNSLIFPIEY